MTNPIRRLAGIAWVGVCLSVLPCRAQVQVTLGGNANLDGGAALGTLASSGGDGKRASPWLYAFTTGGLNCGVYKAYSTVDVDDKYGTSFRLDMGGHSVTGTSGSVSFSTVSTTGWLGAGGVSIVNVNTVEIGAIDTHTTSGYSAPGPVEIGESGSPAGEIRLDYLYGYAGGDLAATVRIYGSGAVRVQTSGGVEGDIDLHGAAARSAWQILEIVHNGDLRVRDIKASVVLPSTGWDIPSGWGGAVTLDGGSRSGSAGIRDLDAHFIFPVSASGPGNGYSGPGNTVIRNYSAVSLRNIDCSYVGKGNVLAGGGGGDVTITNITGDIAISGAIDLSSTNSAADPDAVPGILTLACGGTITLAELALDKMKSASLTSSGKVQVLGKLSGFPTVTPADGTLDAATGMRIYYRPQVAENAYLGGKSYTLKSGGVLRSAPSGTVVFFK